jgi:hypothetical protein|tara:strand:+ start:1879 stop:2121 length:243 start_codon:yes stop_codon:yes gene_type:complete
MKKYKLEKNISITKSGRRPKKYDFPFKDMEVGDSFQMHGTINGNERSTEYNAVYTQAKRKGIKVTSRKQSDGSIRVWRVE